MALQTKEQWVHFFTSIAMPPTQSSDFADIFIVNHTTEDILPEFQNM